MSFTYDLVTNVLLVVLVILLLLRPMMLPKRNNVNKTGVVETNLTPLNFDATLEILNFKIDSAKIELTLAYVGKETTLATKLEEVIKEYSSDVLVNISPVHKASLDHYLGEKYTILLVQRNIRETVFSLVGQR